MRRIYTEIQDRYGKLPDSVENLFEFARLRRFAEKLRIISVDKIKDGFAIKLSENAKIEPEKSDGIFGRIMKVRSFRQVEFCKLSERIEI